MSPTRWQRLMTAFGFSENGDVYADLFAAYSEPHRHYHTREHIDDCLSQLDQAIDSADVPHEIELALWFHDAIYKPRSSSNETKSAEWATTFLQLAGASADQQSRACSYIIATKHDAEPSPGDATLVVDIDLSILGREAKEYDLFEQNIRREYKWVPWPLYRRKRVEILESFMKRRRIYGSDFFYSRYEQRARQNLQRAIGVLQ